MQGFEDDIFQKAAAVNSEAQLAKQIGNSVSVPVIAAIGCRIAEVYNDNITQVPLESNESA